MIFENPWIRVWCLILLMVLTAACDKGNAKLTEDKNPGHQAGGPCLYASFSGRALITKIMQTPASKEQAQIRGGPGYEGYEVWFRFIPDAELPENARHALDREHLFTLYNSWYVGPRYVEKYGLAPDKVFPCTLKHIQSGSCSPIDFQFPTLDRADYFESRAQ
ncbi:hypothetical protein [Desulforhabdus sp. TSK]|uniref:hypothetical protein n=1 Tax=Desulforhabdus sp. TSK TaxID=2925014 RepID=UPI001FC82289|nr:hypothetical protein [Desulforhabdus sp. TSK]GKT08779.1 hypothetical protein DSTSK_20840 [Desulforhabdus sp. TSK]